MTPILKELLEQAAVYDVQQPPANVGEYPSTGSGIASWIDHTALKPETTPAQIELLCKEAVLYGFASVCVNPIAVPLAVRRLETCQIPVCSVIGFPLGACPTATKLAEAQWCLKEGARELDMVIPIGWLKGGKNQYVLDDIRAIVDAAHASRALVKVILEMAFLTRREKMLACLLSQAAGADYVKTSTGFGPSGATIEDVGLMNAVVGGPGRLGVKAAGGIRSLEDAQAMLKAGATRLGASAGVKIIQQALKAQAPCQ